MTYLQPRLYINKYDDVYINLNLLNYNVKAYKRYFIIQIHRQLYNGKLNQVRGGWSHLTGD